MGRCNPDGTKRPTNERWAFGLARATCLCWLAPDECYDPAEPGPGGQRLGVFLESRICRYAPDRPPEEDRVNWLYAPVAPCGSPIDAPWRVFNNSEEHSRPWWRPIPVRNYDTWLFYRFETEGCPWGMV